MTKKKITPQHRATMTAGRREHEAIRRYLEQGIKHDGNAASQADRIEGRLGTAEKHLKAAQRDGNVVEQVKRQAQVDNLKAQLQRVTPAADTEALTEGFIKHAASYSNRHGIGIKTWRKFGVPLDVLERAGLKK